LRLVKQCRHRTIAKSAKQQTLCGCRIGQARATFLLLSC
jgi:hypothetical protein